MKHKKEFFGVLISVLVCVFLVFLAVYATTVGTDITATGDLTVSGNDLTFGNGGTIVNTDADTLTLTEALIDIVGHATVSQEFQVEGNAYFDGVASVAQGILISGDATTALDIDGTYTYGIYLDHATINSGIDIKLRKNATISNSSTGILTLNPAGEYVLIDNGSLQVGNATENRDLIVTGTLQVYADPSGTPASAAYSRFGEGTTGHSAVVSASSDLLISDSLEVDGTAYFDGVVSVSDSGIVVEGPTITAVASPSATCTKGSINLDPDNGVISVCDANSDWTPITPD